MDVLMDLNFVNWIIFMFILVEEEFFVYILREISRLGKILIVIIKKMVFFLKIRYILLN